MANETIAQLQDERIDLLTIRARWNGRGYADLVSLLDLVDQKLEIMVAELKKEATNG
jgi:hypothetical protein